MKYVDSVNEINRLIINNKNQEVGNRTEEKNKILWNYTSYLTTIILKYEISKFTSFRSLYR